MGFKKHISFVRKLVLASLVMAVNLQVHGALLFQDGFESETLGAEWTTDKTNDGRVTLTTQYAPAAGLRHLVFDDAVNDSVYSVAEAILHLNLLNKKNVVLTFKGKNIGNDSHYEPAGKFTIKREFDAVSVSADGGTTWVAVKSLAFITSSSWQTYSVTLDSAVNTSLGATFGNGFLIRFSIYDNAPVPTDGFAIDDVSVTADDDQRSQVVFQPSLVEGSLVNTGTVTLSLVPPSPVTLTFTSSVQGLLNLPASVTVPAGQTSIAFDFSVADDALINFTRTATVKAVATDVTSASATATVVDNDPPPVVSITIPSKLKEGEFFTGNGKISFDRPADVPLYLAFNTSVDGRLFISGTVVPAGQTEKMFQIYSPDDSYIDGDALVTVTASSPYTASATAQVLVIDNENYNLTLDLPTVQEGGSVNASVLLSGVLRTAMTVQITNPSPATLTMPSSITFPLQHNGILLPISAADNAVVDGSRSVLITATAPGFVTASKSITIWDNELMGYVVTPPGDIVDVDSAITVRVDAADVEGNPINNVPATVDLSVIEADGTVLPLPSSTANLVAGTWSGPVTLPPGLSPPLRLRATDSMDRKGDSRPFDVMHRMPLTVADLAWDATRSRIYASVPATATGAYASKVVVIDPATLQITGSIAAGSDPKNLTLTSGNEFLYVALIGDGTVAKINLSTLAVDYSFAVGSNPDYGGIMYAADMAAVAGQPDVLVISRYSKTASPRHSGVAVYDHGLMRPVVTQNHTGSDMIEGSSDPSVFFGAPFGGGVVYKLVVDSTGVTQVQTISGLGGSLGNEMRAGGDKLFGASGFAVNAAQQTPLGTVTFYNSFAWPFPELTTNRVYCLERRTTFPWEVYDNVSVFNPHTFQFIRRLKLSPEMPRAWAFIRWGDTGLAFRSDTSLLIASSTLLVPDEPSADLVTSVQTSTLPPLVGIPFTYTVQVTNQGPNVARSTSVSALLSTGQAVQSISSSSGSSSFSANSGILTVGDLAVGATVTFTLVAMPQSAGSLSFTASATSIAKDPVPGNNTAVTSLVAEYRAAPDTTYVLRQAVNNLVYDPLRKVLWATIPGTVAAPMGKSLVSIDPLTGKVSSPIALNSAPLEGSIALSGNSRYLYLGLADAYEVLRFDLSATPVTSLRISTGLWGGFYQRHAYRIGVLDGNGTSFMVAGDQTENTVSLFDGVVQRPATSSVYGISSMARTASPGSFIGAGYYGRLTRFTVTASETVVDQTDYDISMGEICTSGHLALGKNGILVNNDDLSVLANLGLTGIPCVDEPAERAFLIDDNVVHAFDTVTFAALNTLALPVPSGQVYPTYSWWALSCVRWGNDGLAIRGIDSNLCILRWSEIHPNADLNANGLPDSWERISFGAITPLASEDPDHDGIPNALEYLFGTSPTKPGINPVTMTAEMSGGSRYFKLAFPRRAGSPAGRYRFEFSPDLKTWSPVTGSAEGVVSTASPGGILMENVEALVPLPAGRRGFVRIAWVGP